MIGSKGQFLKNPKKGHSNQYMFDCIHFIIKYFFIIFLLSDWSIKTVMKLLTNITIKHSTTCPRNTFNMVQCILFIPQLQVCRPFYFIFSFANCSELLSINIGILLAKKRVFFVWPQMCYHFKSATII